MPNYTMDQPEYWFEADKFGLMDNIRTSSLVLGNLDTSPRIVVMDMGPAFLIPRHSHGCERYEMIVTGSLYSGEEVFHPGDIMLAHADEVYGPKMAGPEGCMTVEVFERDDTAASAYELDDGTIFHRAVGQGFPDNIAGMDWITEKRAKIMAEMGQAK